MSSNQDPEPAVQPYDSDPDWDSDSDSDSDEDHEDPQNLPTALLLSEAECRIAYLWKQVAVLLSLCRPITLYIQQRHRHCLMPNSRGATVAKKYADCRTVLESALQGQLGVVAEQVGEMQEPQKAADTATTAKWSVNAGRSSTDRKRWLELLEEEMRRKRGEIPTSRFHEVELELQKQQQQQQRQQESGGKEPVPVAKVGARERAARLKSRGEPFEERRPTREMRELHHWRVEYNAAAAASRDLHPGLPFKPPGRLLSQPRKQEEGSRNQTQSRPPSPVTLPPLSPHGIPTPLLSAGKRKNALPVTQSTATITTAETDALFKNVGYNCLPGSWYFKWALKRRNQKTGLLAHKEEVKNQLSAGTGEGPPKPRKTTSGVPSEIRAGTFSGGPCPLRKKVKPEMAGGQKEKAPTAPTTRRWKPRGPLPVPWAFDPEVKTHAGSNSAAEVVRESLIQYNKSAAPDSESPSPSAVRHPDLAPRPPSALPPSPSYGTIPPLAPLFHNDLTHVPPGFAKSTSPSPFCAPVNEQAIWMQCAERLDHVSKVAATDAWARIQQEKNAKVYGVDTTKAGRAAKGKQVELDAGAAASVHEIAAKWAERRALKARLESAWFAKPRTKGTRGAGEILRAARERSFSDASVVAHDGSQVFDKLTALEAPIPPPRTSSLNAATMLRSGSLQKPAREAPATMRVSLPRASSSVENAASDTASRPSTPITVITRSRKSSLTCTASTCPHKTLDTPAESGPSRERRLPAALTTPSLPLRKRPYAAQFVDALDTLERGESSSSGAGQVGTWTPVSLTGKVVEASDLGMEEEARSDSALGMGDGANGGVEGKVDKGKGKAKETAK